MQKNDLKSGYLLEIEEDNKKYLAKIEFNHNDILCISSSVKWFTVNYLSNDLKFSTGKVIKVYGRCKSMFLHQVSTTGRVLLWERLS